MTATAAWMGIPGVLSALLLRGADAWPMVVIAVALLTAALALWYPPQVRGRAGGWQWALPSLRGAALAALALSLVQPVITRTRTVEEEGTILVMLDRSASMSVSDRALAGSGDRVRALGQTMALAEALGRLPEGSRRRPDDVLPGLVERMGRLVEEVDRMRRQMEYARLAGRDYRESRWRHDEAVRELQEAVTSAQRRVQRVLPESGMVGELAVLATELSRSDYGPQWLARVRERVGAATRSLRQLQDELDAYLYETEPEIRNACDLVAGSTRLGLSWEAMAGGRDSLLARLDARLPLVAYAAGDGLAAIDVRELREHAEATRYEPPRVEAEAGASDLLSSLRRALQQMGRTPVQAAVLFSDGRRVGDIGGGAGAVLPPGVPVFSVFAASGRTRDLAVARVDMPESIFEGEALSVRCELLVQHMEPGALAGEVKISVDGRVVQGVQLTSVEGRLAPVTFTLPPLERGVHRIRCSVPYQPGEATDENNHVERWVKVLSQRLRIMLIGGSGNWELRYLRDVLSSAPFVELQEVQVAPGGAVESTPWRIASQDLVILNDVEPGMMDEFQWESVLQAVEARGGSVIIIPGLSHPQHELARHAMQAMLPYGEGARPSWQTWPGEDPTYHATVAPGEEWLEALRLGTDPEDNVRQWDRLGGFYRLLSLPSLRPEARVLLSERRTGSPLLTEIGVGAGRAFFLATNETWRWRRGVGARDHERFWLQLIRHALGEPYTLTAERLSIDLDRVIAAPEQPVRIRAKVAPREGLREEGAVAPSVQVLRGGQFVSASAMERVDRGRGGRFFAMVSDLPEGDYEIAVTFTDDAEAPPENLRMPLRVERATDAEMVDVTGDRAVLEEIAEVSGGRCLDLESAGELPQLLSAVRQRQTRVVELPLWHSPYLFLFVVGCLCAEWALRKKAGLS